MPMPPSLLTVSGVTKTIKQWSEESKIPMSTIRCRLRQGWSPEKTLGTPVDLRFSRNRPKPTSTRKPPLRVPPMIHHKSGQAAVDFQLHGQRHSRYFGVYGSPEAQEGYKRFTAEYLSGKLLPGQATSKGACIAELGERWLTYCEKTYRKRDKETSEVHLCRQALRFLLPYATLPVEEFLGSQLREVMDAAVKAGLALRTVNGIRERILRMFDWGTLDNLATDEQVNKLRKVKGLIATRTTAKAPVKKQPVPEADIEAVFPLLHKNPQRLSMLQTILRVHQLTGGRPIDICAMRVRDIDRTGKVWHSTTSPDYDKVIHLGKRTVLSIGPKAQALLLPWIEAAGKGGWLFQTQRGKPVEEDYYCRSIKAACKRAGVPVWTPHRLRHTYATAAAKEALRMAAGAIGDSQEVTGTNYLSEEQIRDFIAERVG